MDEVLLNQFKEYKKFQSSKYIPVRGDEITTRVFEFDKYYVSTKIDGHLCFIYKENKEVYLYNFNGKSFNRKEFYRLQQIEFLHKQNMIDDDLFWVK